MYYSYSGNSIYYDEEDQYTKIEYEELETSEYINNVRKLIVKVNGMMIGYLYTIIAKKSMMI